MNFSKKLRLSICMAMIISLLFSVISFAKTSERIRSEVLRLHVIANSDTAEDQALKLRVRDFILKTGTELFDGSVDVNNALERLKPNIPDLTEKAQVFIREQGYDMNVRITLSREYFTTRTYGNVTLPAGKYLALRVIIGEGKGHNWWCVMFPAMCIPAADKHSEIDNVFDDDEIALVQKNPKYEVRFKVVELFERLKNKINS